MKNLDELLTIAQEAADIGAHMMVTQAPGTVSAKGDRDYVTELDVKIQHEIRDYLHRTTPRIEFLGEEHGGGVVDESADYVWVVDPIDGTSNFAHGIPLCATQLALVHKGVPVVGVIDAPFLNLRYHATKDSGAYANNKPIHTNQNTSLRKAIVSIGDYATGRDSDKKNQRRLAITKALAKNVERVRMFGSAALDLSWTAEGRTDSCIILSNKHWDILAGLLIATESKAAVTDVSGDTYDLRSTSIMAGNITLLKDLQPSLR